MKIVIGDLRYNMYSSMGEGIYNGRIKYNYLMWEDCLMGIITTTSNNVEGYSISEYIKVINKNVIFKSGLGKTILAGISDLVESFSFSDIELSGSTELIQNACDYVFDLMVNEAKKLGADAIIAIDFEASYGVDISRVSCNGTAVKLLKKPLYESKETSIDIDGCELTQWLRINHFVLVETMDDKKYGIRIDGNTYKRLQFLAVDIVFVNVFGDETTISKVIFPEIVFEKGKIGDFTMESDFESDIKIRAKEIRKIKILIKKCQVADKSYSVDDLEELEKQNNIFALQDYWAEIESLNSALDILNYIKKLPYNNDEIITYEIIPKIEEIVYAEKIYGNRKNKYILFLQQFIDNL